MSCVAYIILWAAIAVIATLIILYLAINIYIANLRASFIRRFNEHLSEFCANLPPITYRESVYLPFDNGTYERRLAIALSDIAFNTSKANCANILPLPNPPGFDNQLRVEGADPINGQSVMFAYIFWNSVTRQAVISFTGTELISEWQSDLQFEQVAPTSLNGYENGVLVHKGFYDIYLAIRGQLWEWWGENSSSITTLYVTGHSLGAALSTICAYDFAHTPDSFIHYSFAAPRSGNSKYAQVFNLRVPQSLRVNNTEDIIPQLPPATWQGLNYEQTGGNVPFTISLPGLIEDHIQAYTEHLPICPQVAPCHID